MGLVVKVFNNVFPEPFVFVEVEEELFGPAKSVILPDDITTPELKSSPAPVNWYLPYWVFIPVTEALVMVMLSPARNSPNCWAVKPPWEVYWAFTVREVNKNKKIIAGKMYFIDAAIIGLFVEVF